jgi:hypothetical protein
MSVVSTITSITECGTVACTVLTLLLLYTTWPEVAATTHKELQMIQHLVTTAASFSKIHKAIILYIHKHATIANHKGITVQYVYITWIILVPLCGAVLCVAT